jgi:hypothetical protein
MQQASYSLQLLSESQSPAALPPAAERKDQYVSDLESENGRRRRRRRSHSQSQRCLLCSLRTDACLCTRTTRAGQGFLCAPGLQEGGPHDI